MLTDAQKRAVELLKHKPFSNTDNGYWMAYFNNDFQEIKSRTIVALVKKGIVSIVSVALGSGITAEYACLVKEV